MAGDEGEDAEPVEGVGLEVGAVLVPSDSADAASNGTEAARLSTQPQINARARRATSKSRACPASGLQ